MKNNFVNTFFKRGLGAGQDVVGCVVTSERSDIDTGFTVVAKDTGKRYAILHNTLYQRLKPYLHKDYVWVDEKLAYRLIDERRFLT